jgi:peptide/nickel transport system substrate-binding protein
MRRLRRLVVLVAAAAIATSAVGGLAYAAAPRQASEDGTVRVGYDFSGVPIEFDLMKVAVVGTQYHNLVYGTLLKIKPNGEVVPDLAKSVTAVDPSTIKVVLKPKLKFTDGTPVDAEAYKFSIERMLNEAPVGAKEADINQIDSVTVDSPSEFTIRLKTPVAGAITRLMRFCEVGCPVSPTAVSKGTNFSTDPVGAGPYTLESVTPGQEFVLKKNPGYWDAKSIKIPKIQVKNVPGAATVTAITGNQSDFAVVTQIQADELAGAPNVKVTSKPTDNSMLVGHMCKSRPPFDNLQVRQALNYATDRDDFNEKLYGGKGEDMWGWFKSGNPNHDPELDGYYAYNVKKAKKLLKEAGQENLSFDLLYIPGNPDSETGAQIAQQQWSKAGITATPKPLTNPLDFFPNATAGPMILFGLSRSGIAKVARTLAPGSIGGVCSYDDPELNTLITKAQGLPDGSPELAQTWHDISKLTLDDALMDFILFGVQSYAENTANVAKLQVAEGRLAQPEIYYWGSTLK